MQYTPLKLGSYDYPAWANAIGWLISLSVIAPIPIVVIMQLAKGEGSLRKVNTILTYKCRGIQISVKRIFISEMEQGCQE